MSIVPAFQHSQFTQAQTKAINNEAQKTKEV